MYVRCSVIDRQMQARRGRRPSTAKTMSTLRARPCTCKRTRRAARMAVPPAAANRSPSPRPAAPPPAAARSSVFISTYDWNDGCLVYGVRVESAAPPSSSDDPTTPAMEILRPSAEPLVCWSEEQHKLSALAAVSGGATILGLVARSRETLVRDVATPADAPGPRLRRSKRHPVMLPVGNDTVLVMDMELRRPGRCCFEALRRVPGGGWRAEAVPDPPAAFLDDDGITGYFAMGSRAWISVSGKGTLSLDMAEIGGAWRVEGTWELPLSERGIFVPELGVVIGVPRRLSHKYQFTRCVQVCALDVEGTGGRPPAVLRVCDIPPPECVEAADMPCSPEVVSLAYLGDGRFCVSRSVDVKVPRPEGGLCREKGTSFTLVDASRLPDGGDLELAKHGKAHCHVWPFGDTGHATFLQTAY